MEKYKTVIPRILAGLIDIVVFIPVIVIDVTAEMSPLPLLLLLCWQPIGKLFGSVYYMFFHHRFGQSIGKMACRVKVVDHRSEGSISFAQAFLRNSIDFTLCAVEMFGVMILLLKGYAIESDTMELFTNVMAILLLIYGVADLTVLFFNPQRRAFHDLIAGTVVIRIDEQNFQTVKEEFTEN